MHRIRTSAGRDRMDPKWRVKGKLDTNPEGGHGDAPPHHGDARPQTLQRFAKVIRRTAYLAAAAQADRAAQDMIHWGLLFRSSMRGPNAPERRQGPTGKLGNSL